MWTLIKIKYNIFSDMLQRRYDLCQACLVDKQLGNIFAQCFNASAWHTASEADLYRLQLWLCVLKHLHYIDFFSTLSYKNQMVKHY